MLSWLLEEGRGNEARQALARADRIFTSDLTLIECDRVLHRAAATGRLEEAVASENQDRRCNGIGPLDTCASWTSRSSRPHAAVSRTNRCARWTRSTWPPLSWYAAWPPDARVLSLDDRVRANALALGFDVVPAQATV